jgi:hypothetical protein
METDAIASALVTDEIAREIGWDLSFGLEYRPFLTDNLKLNAGMGMLFPGAGFEDIYSKTTTTMAGYSSASSKGNQDVFCSAFLSAIVTF